ncbi:hypothetical protein GCM10010390_91740 [Streptomyces mordarskii]|uniref:Uncharacterized protein n=1 Tax=Streptomyces mordarskii TaxID=1226758 RepID=A0ABP3PWV7_9ACTN
MDYDRGLVLYGLDGMVRRTGLSRATVKRHVAVLRELGALVWVRCGSKRNLRLPGRAYTATATVYGAVIPPCFDQAMGHRLAGDGYEARVCGVTEAGRERAVAAARTAVEPVDKRAVDNRRSLRREPHSLGGSPPVGKVEVVGGGKDTSRARRPTTSPARKLRKRRGPRRSARQVAQDIGIARQVRPLVAWTQRESLRRLAYTLRPLIDGGLDSMQIAAELHGMCMGWRPAKPAAYIRAALARDAQHDADLAAGDPDQPYAFRRDAQLSRGLPSTPGAMTLVPCARRGCANLARGKPMDRVRCDECELEVWQTRQARRALESALAAPLPPPAEPPIATAEAPLPSAVPHAQAEAADAVADPDGNVVLPGPVREQLLALAAIAPHDLPAARAAAHAAYQPAREAESAQQHARRVSAATATWCAITTRYADQLASAHDAGSAA